MKWIAGAGLAWLILVIVAFIGWVANIAELLQRHSTLWDIVIGVVGVFAAPVGVIRGWGHIFGLC